MNDYRGAQDTSSLAGAYFQLLHHYYCSLFSTNTGITDATLFSVRLSLPRFRVVRIFSCGSHSQCELNREGRNVRTYADRKPHAALSTAIQPQTDLTDFIININLLRMRASCHCRTMLSKIYNNVRKGCYNFWYCMRVCVSEFLINIRHVEQIFHLIRTILRTYVCLDSASRPIARTSVRYKDDDDIKYNRALSFHNPHTRLSTSIRVYR